MPPRPSSIPPLLLLSALLPGCGAGTDGGPPPGPPPLQGESFALPAAQDFASPGAWVLVAIELPQGYDPSLIDLSTVHINDWVHPDPGFQNLVDLDLDGIDELQVRVTGFCFLQSLYCVVCNPAGDQVDFLASGQTDTGSGKRSFLAWGSVSVTNLPYNFCGAQPYLQNESFEFSSDPEGRPDCWQYFDSDDADDDDWTEGWYGFGWIEPTHDGTFASDGDYSASLTMLALCPNVGRSGYRQRVAVTGGQTYAFWAWAFVDGLTASAVHPQDRVDMEFRFFDANGNPLPAPPAAANANPIYLDTSGWEQMFTPDFQAPPNAAIMEMSLLLIINAPPLGDISVWFDDAL
ncbi:MAG: hypothetical protein ACE5R4_13705 [Armatimonadota bacterium]